MIRHLQTAMLALGVWAGLAAVSGGQTKASPGELIYFATRGTGPGQGVFAARLDPQTGKLTALGLAAQLDRPSWIEGAPGGTTLYATDEANVGGVVALKPDRASGQLQKLNQVASEGAQPPYLFVDSASSTVLVANYGDGHVAALPIQADGTLGPAVSTGADTGNGPSPRQVGPHAHQIVLDPSGRFALVPDLGADRVFIYRFDRTSRTLSLGEPRFELLPPGSGPRHLVFSPNGKRVYLVTELSAEVRAYDWDGARGALRLMQTLPLAGPGQAKSGAEIRTAPDGRFLYVSNRIEDVVVVYVIDAASGRLSEMQRIAAGGKTPWGFALDPSGRWLLVADEGSNAAVLFKRDPRTGRLSQTDQKIEVPTPDDVLFVKP